MGKRWRDYRVGDVRLRRLGDEGQAVWYEGGKRKRHRLRTEGEIPSRAALDAFVRDRERDAVRDKSLIGDIFVAYVKDRKRDGKHVDVMYHNWKALAPRFDALTVDQINDEMCRAYAAERFELGMASSTVHTELNRLRTALKWAEKRQIIDRAPYIWAPLKSPPRDRVLSELELQKLLEACDTPHIKLFIILALTTAGRTRAILELTWDRVDFELGTIDLRAPRKVDPLRKEVQKGRAKVPMNSLARAVLLQAYLERICNYVVEWNGKPVLRVTKAFNRARARAGLPDVMPHTIRHTAASWQQTKGVPMEQISKFLGHVETRTTETVYAKADVDYLSDAAEAVNLKVVK